MTEKLHIDADTLKTCRANAAAIADGIQPLITGNTTVAVERTIARLLGIDGVDREGVPLPNRVVEDLTASPWKASGLYAAMGAAVRETGKSPAEIAADIARGSYSFGGTTVSAPGSTGAEEALAAMEPWLEEGLGRIREAREQREHQLLPAWHGWGGGCALDREARGAERRARSCSAWRP